jgi:hypothetical protein
MFELLLESKYVHKKDEWLGYGDYAVVLVSGNFSPASAINKGPSLRRQSSPELKADFTLFTSNYSLIVEQF